VILARSFNIPTLVGVDRRAVLPWVDTQVQIDGNAGLLVVDPSPAVARYYQQEAWVQAQIRQQQQVWLDKAGRKTVSAWRSRPISPIR
jgi:fructose-specific PTS system IIA-like component